MLTIIWKMNLVGLSLIYIISVVNLQGVYLYKPENEVLGRFMELHHSYCSSVDLCTIKAGSSPVLTDRQIPCCQPCSCEKSCINFGTCCPDYWLQRVIGNNTFQTTEDISQALGHLNATELPDKSVLSEIKDTISDEYECVEAKAITHSPFYKSLRQINSYWMVNTCPRRFEDRNTVAKCIADRHSIKLFIKGFGGNNTKLLYDMLVPVTSLRTNVTYRNIHCLKCNEERLTADDIELWVAVFSCSWEVVDPDSITNPYILFEVVSTKQTKYCNFVFNPTEAVNAIAATCSRADVYQCPQNSDNLTDYFCRHYDLPVIQINSDRELITYKNIACYICNENKTFELGCNHFYPPYTESNFEMNFLHDKNKNLVLYNGSEQGPLHLPVAGAHYRRCGPGLLRDTLAVSTRCRRILCPRFFYPLQGACIPMFTTMEGIHFAVRVIAKPLQDVRMDLLDKFDEELRNAIERIAAEIFQSYTYVFWQMANTQRFFYNLVKLSFSPVGQSITYIDMLTKVELFQTKVARLKIDTGVDEIDTEVHEESNEIFENLGAMHDVRTRVSLTEKVSKRESIDRSTSEWIIKLKYHKCYRVAIDFEDVMFLGGPWNVIKRNGIKIGKNDVEIGDKWQWFVCIEDIFLKLKSMRIQLGKSIIKASSKTTPNPKATGYAKENSSFDTIANAPTEIVLSVVFATVGFLIITVKAIRYVRNRLRGA